MIVAPLKYRKSGVNFRYSLFIGSPNSGGRTKAQKTDEPPIYEQQSPAQIVDSLFHPEQGQPGVTAQNAEGEENQDSRGG